MEATTNLISISPFFIAKDLQASISYYVERLGFQLDFQGPDDDPYYARVSRDGVGIILKAILPDVLPQPNHTRHEWARRDAYIYTTGSEGATRIRLLDVTPGYLSAAGGRLVAGRGITHDDGRTGAPPVVLLVDRLWRSRYGSRADLIGRTIDLDATPRIVVGVVADVASDVPGLRFDAFAPLPADGPAALTTTARGVAWLKPGVTLEAAQGEMVAVTGGALSLRHA